MKPAFAALWISMILLAACCTSPAAAQTDSKDVSKEVAALIEQLLDEDLGVRLEATRELAELGPSAKAAVPALYDARKTASLKEVEAIDEALVKIGVLPVISCDNSDDALKKIAHDFLVNNNFYVPYFHRFKCLIEKIDLDIIKTSIWYSVPYYDFYSVGPPDHKYAPVCLIEIESEGIVPCASIENDNKRNNGRYKAEYIESLNNIIEKENLSIRSDNVIDYAIDVHKILTSITYSIIYTNEEQKTTWLGYYGDEADRYFPLFDEYCMLPEITATNEDSFDIRLCIFHPPRTRCMTRYRGGVRIHDMIIYTDGSIVVRNIEDIDFSDYLWLHKRISR